MEEIAKMLKKIQEDMENQRKDMANMKMDITNCINNNINEKFKQIENSQGQLEEKFEIQKRLTESLDFKLRRKNLIFFGLEDAPRYYNELENFLIQFIKEKLKINCDESHIEYVKLIGKSDAKSRPILATFATMGQKIEILKFKSRLSETSFYIKEDLSKENLIKHKILQTQVENEKEKGNHAIIRGGKVIIKGKIRENDKRKRSITKSPQSQAQPNQIQKTDAFQYMRAKSYAMSTKNVQSE